MALKILLFVEGESNSPNGDLRQGLSKLLEQKIKGKLPRIILGNGKMQTIDKFKNNRLLTDLSLLLIDLDKPETEIENDLIDNNLLNQKDCVFYMIQEMENWFLSQPEILDKFYGKDENNKLISQKLPKKKAHEIEKPDEKLQEISKNTKRGEYHKIKHGIELLKLLDASKLEDDVPEFKRLIKKLK